MKNQNIYRFIFCGLLLLLGWLAAYQNVVAQSQPVQATLQLSPPYSVYLPDYGVPGSEQMRIQLLLRDIAEPEYPVRLHLVVEGNGIRIETNPAFYPQPIYLQGGIPTMVSGEVLGPYLESSHLLFSGISRQNYEQKGSLPEGMYTFSVHVLDYRRTDVVLSNEAVFMAWLMLNDPPRINTPICGSELPLNELQSVLFQWMPGGAASPNAAFDTEYEFTLVEVRPQGRNPEDAIRSTMPLFQQTTDFTSLVYGISEPPLIPGQQYAFRVRASDKQGRDLFKNQGYSPVCTFTYGDIDPLEPPEGINVYAEAERRARISWEMSINPDSYRVEYRKQPKEGESFSWFTTETTEGELTLYDLEPETNYEVRVASLFQGFASRYTQIHTFTTPALRIVTCGERPDIRSYEDVAPLPSAIAGQYWQVGNFEMQLLEVRGGDGMFSGLGSITVSYLGLQVPVKFDHVQVNRNRELFRGEVHALSEEIDSFRKRWIEENPLQENTDEPNLQQAETPVSTEEAIPLAPETLSVEGTIANVTVNTTGQIVISREDGSIQTYTQARNQETGEKQATTILDSQGNSYVVDKEGGVSNSDTGNNNGSPSDFASEKDDLAIRLFGSILEDFAQRMEAWLSLQSKGPLSKKEINTLEKLPSCLPQDAAFVQQLADEDLPKLQSDKAHFVTLVKQTHQANLKTVLDAYDGQATWNDLSAEHQAILEEAACNTMMTFGIDRVIVCLAGAVIDVGLQYTFQWVGMWMEDQPVDFNNYEAIMAKMDASQVAVSAGIACTAAVLPIIPSTKNKLIVAVVAGLGDGAYAMANNIYVQYDVIKQQHPEATIEELFTQLDWRQALVEGGTNFAITSIATGVTLYARSNPKFTDFAQKLEAKFKVQGTAFLESAGLDQGSIDLLLKKLGISRGDKIVLGAGKVSKSNLLSVTWKNNIFGHKSTTDAVTFWNNSSKEFKHLIDGDFYLKFDNQAGNLFFGNHKTGEVYGFYEGFKNIEIINERGIDGMLEKLKSYHGIGSPSYVKLNVSSGARIIANPDKTATIVGNYIRFPWSQGDMKELVSELLGDLKNQQFGAKKGGFNVLNVADEMVSDWDNFWDDFNKPWLNAAIQRKDDIWAASNPMELNLLFKKLDRVPLNQLNTPEKLAEFFKSLHDPIILEQITGFGNEIKLLSENGYIYDATSKMFIK